MLGSGYASDSSGSVIARRHDKPSMYAYHKHFPRVSQLNLCSAGDEICRGIADVARLVYHSARAWGRGCGPNVPSARSNVLRRHIVTALQSDGTAVFEACCFLDFAHQAAYVVGMQQLSL